MEKGKKPSSQIYLNLEGRKDSDKEELQQRRSRAISLFYPVQIIIILHQLSKSRPTLHKNSMTISKT